jgi:ABC-type multidrug transport system ATPase subunit
MVRRSRRALSLRGVTKRWPGAAEPVLDGVDLHVEPGAVVRIEGPNGAGKTTLLRVAAGLIRPEAGRVHLGDLDVEGDRIAFQRDVGFVSAASAGLYARLTVRDHLRLWSRLALMGRRESAAARERVLDGLGLRPLAYRRVDRLSNGERQRVRLAGAFLHDPAIVLLDEPLTSLDEEGGAQLVTEVQRVCSSGGAAVLCAPSGERDPVPSDLRLTIRGARLEPA